jgi:hypothetical protein
MPFLRSGARAAAIAVIVAVSCGDAAGQGKRAREREAAPAPPAVDQRDRLVQAPGSRLAGKPFWHALSQCGGIYFKMSTLHADAAAQAQVVRKDANAAKKLARQAEAARRSATAFFDAAEMVLMADRGIARPEAILTYDGLATEAATRLKSIEAASEAAKPCRPLYEICHKSLPKICGDALPQG